MAKYIDADWLLNPRRMEFYYHLKNGDTAIPIQDIQHAPTIDIVHCHECRFFDEKELVCEPTGLRHNRTDFCSSGERRIDEEH